VGLATTSLDVTDARVDADRRPAGTVSLGAGAQAGVDHRRPTGRGVTIDPKAPTMPTKRQLSGVGPAAERDLSGGQGGGHDPG